MTDKENALIHSFSSLIENKLITQQQNQQIQIQDNNLHNNLKTNGKLIDFDPLSSNDDDKHHQNDIIKGPISNGNGHPLISNLDNKM